jgi:hypothetical protein
VPPSAGTNMYCTSREGFQPLQSDSERQYSPVKSNITGRARSRSVALASTTIRPADRLTGELQSPNVSGSTYAQGSAREVPDGRKPEQGVIGVVGTESVMPRWGSGIFTAGWSSRLGRRPRPMPVPGEGYGSRRATGVRAVEALSTRRIHHSTARSSAVPPTTVVTAAIMRGNLTATGCQ